MPRRGGGRGFVASADISPGTLLLLERRFLPMPTPTDCGLAGGIGQVQYLLAAVLQYHFEAAWGIPVMWSMICSEACYCFSFARLAPIFVQDSGFARLA